MASGGKRLERRIGKICSFKPIRSSPFTPKMTYDDDEIEDRQYNYFHGNANRREYYEPTKSRKVKRQTNEKNQGNILSDLSLREILKDIKELDLRFPPTASREDLIQLLIDYQEGQTSISVVGNENSKMYSHTSSTDDITTREDLLEDLREVNPMKRIRTQENNDVSRSDRPFDDLSSKFVRQDDRTKFRQRHLKSNTKTYFRKRRPKSRERPHHDRWVDDDSYGNDMGILDELLLPLSIQTSNGVSSVTKNAKSIVKDIAPFIENIEHGEHSSFMHGDRFCESKSGTDGDDNGRNRNANRRSKKSPIYPTHKKKSVLRTQRKYDNDKYASFRNDEQFDEFKVDEQKQQSVINEITNHHNNQSHAPYHGRTEKKVYGVWTDDDDNISKRLEEMYGVVSAQAVENIGDTFADIIEGIYWNEPQDLANSNKSDRYDLGKANSTQQTSSTALISEHNQAQKRNWKDRVAYHVDSTFGLHNSEINITTHKDRLSDAVSIFSGRENKEDDDGNLWGDMTLGPNLFGKSRQKLKKIFSRTSGDNICTSLVTSTLKTSIKIMVYLCNWTTCKGMLPKSIVVFFFASSAFFAPRKHRLMTIGTTFLVLRIIAETLHRGRRGNKGWDNKHVENNVEIDPTIYGTKKE